MDELKRLYLEDQHDRHEKLFEKNSQLFAQRDEQRLTRILDLLNARAIRTPADHLRAALILIHGKTTEHYEKSHELAKKAAEMGYRPEKDEVDPLWLAAAAKDRALMSQGKPQLYGTQMRRDTLDGLWHLHEVDPSITDEERSRWHVRPLEETRKRIEERNRKENKK
ncbi:MAG: hypothetical protein AAB652_02735 [Patescibacteria group bacterium]